MAKSKMKKRPDGLYQISVMVEEAGKKKGKYFYGHTQQEAKRKMIARQEKQAAGRTFSEVANEWQKKHWKEIALATQNCYAPALKRALDDFADYNIGEIAPLDVKRSVDAMAKQNYAHHSVTIYLCVLKQIFDHGILMQDVRENPTAAVKVPKGLKTTIRTCLDEDKLDVIRQNTDKPFGLFPYMLLYTGLRRGELLALQWQDIDFGRKKISVTKSVTYAGDGNQPKIKSTKTEAGDREIILLDRLAVILFEKRTKPTDYIFGGVKPLTQSVYRTAWLNYCVEVGLYTTEPVLRERRGKKVTVLENKPAVTPHQLRHGFATMCYEVGIDPTEAQQLLGHKKLEVTMDTYTHIRKSRMEKVAEKLNQAQ